MPAYIPFPQRRKDEMAAYARRHYGVSSWRLKPSMIVLHVTQTATAGRTREIFVPDVASLGELPGTCAHFVVGQDGQVMQLVPVTVMCRHTIGVNDKAIGIEMVQQTAGRSAHWADQQILGRPAQIRAALLLVRKLQHDHGIADANVVGHATANAAPQFRDRRGWRNDHQDWQAADVAEFRRRLELLP